MDGLILGAAGMLGAIALAVGVVWVLALRGQRWAQVLMLIVGLVLALLASPFPQRLHPTAGPSLRGKEKVDAEWHLVCAVHNIGKLFRSGRAGGVIVGWDRPKGRPRGSRALGWA